MDNETMIAERANAYARDARWLTMLVGLGQLDDDELSRLHCEVTQPESATRLMTDSGNYDPGSGRWCALAVGVGVLEHVAESGTISPTASHGRGVFVELARRRHPDFSTNRLSGVDGNIFQENRLFDLRLAVSGIRAARRQSASSCIEWAAAEAEHVFVLGARAVGSTAGNARA